LQASLVQNQTLVQTVLIRKEIKEEPKNPMSMLINLNYRMKSATCMTKESRLEAAAANIYRRPFKMVLHQPCKVKVLSKVMEQLKDLSQDSIVWI